MNDGVTRSPTSKFDLQLSQALIDEKRLAEIFSAKRIERVELKSESVQWEDTRNICIEVARDGQPSGLMVTEADYWVHELKRDNQPRVYLMFPVERLKELCADAERRGWRKENAGDGKRQSVVILRLWDILR